MSKVTYIKERLFRTNYIKVCDEWIEGCVEWFLSEDTEISNDVLYSKSMEQWLLADIGDSGQAILPNSLSTNNKNFALNGKYALQVQYVLDISESPYNQLRDLYNLLVDETEEESRERQSTQKTKKRVLKLELTDGYQTISAMEYRPLPSLHSKTLPGFKMLLIGPVKCVNKVLLLEPHNIKVLGGEVEKLAVVNAFENVLLKALGKPLKDNPKTEYSGKQTFDQSQIANPDVESLFVETRPAQQQQIQSAPTADDFDDDDLFLNVNLDQIDNEDVIETEPQADPQHDWGEHDDDDDSIFAATDIPNMSIAQNAIVQTSDDENEDDFDMLNIESEIEEEYRMAEANEITSRSDNNRQNLNVRIFDRLYEYKVECCPLVTIDQLERIPCTEKQGKIVVIKGEISRIVRKLKIRNYQFSMEVFLMDGSEHQLEVHISDEVLSNIAGVTARELQIMRQQMQEQPLLRTNMQEIFDMLKENLNNLNTYMKIDLNGEKPILIQLIESTTNLDQLLKQKLQRENIQKL